MGEKVIHEVKLIETDDGFRLEVKGDKERIRERGFGPGMMGFGMGRGFRHRGGSRGRRGWHPGYGYGPWWADEPDAGDEPPADV